MGYKKTHLQQLAICFTFCCSFLALGVASLVILSYFAKYLRAIFTILGAQRALSVIHFPTRRDESESAKRPNACSGRSQLPPSLAPLSASLLSLLLGCYASW